MPSISTRIALRKEIGVTRSSYEGQKTRLILSQRVRLENCQIMRLGEKSIVLY